MICKDNINGHSENHGANSKETLGLSALKGTVIITLGMLVISTSTTSEHLIPGPIKPIWESIGQQ